MIQNLFLYDLNASKNPHLTYFELVSLTDEDSTAIKAKFSHAFFRIARLNVAFIAVKYINCVMFLKVPMKLNAIMALK